MFFQNGVPRVVAKHLVFGMLMTFLTSLIWSPAPFLLVSAAGSSASPSENNRNVEQHQIDETISVVFTSMVGKAQTISGLSCGTTIWELKKEYFFARHTSNVQLTTKNGTLLEDDEGKLCGIFNAGEEEFLRQSREKVLRLTFFIVPRIDAFSDDGISGSDQGDSNNSAKVHTNFTRCDVLYSRSGRELLLTGQVIDRSDRPFKALFQDLEPHTSGQDSDTIEAIFQFVLRDDFENRNTDAVCESLEDARIALRTILFERRKQTSLQQRQKSDVVEVDHNVPNWNNMVDIVIAKFDQVLMRPELSDLPRELIDILNMIFFLVVGLSPDVKEKIRDCIRRLILASPSVDNVFFGDEGMKGTPEGPIFQGFMMLFDGVPDLEDVQKEICELLPKIYPPLPWPNNSPEMRVFVKVIKGLNSVQNPKHYDRDDKHAYVRTGGEQANNIYKTSEILNSVFSFYSRQQAARDRESALEVFSQVVQKGASDLDPVFVNNLIKRIVQTVDERIKDFGEGSYSKGEEIDAVLLLGSAADPQVVVDAILKLISLTPNGTYASLGIRRSQELRDVRDVEEKGIKRERVAEIFDNEKRSWVIYYMQVQNANAKKH